MSLNYFDSTSVPAGTETTSTVNKTDLVSFIQGLGADDYFDATNELGEVWVYYTHEDGRQEKKIDHTGSGLTGTVTWSTNAQDGTWEKSKVRVFNHDGSTRLYGRADIGSAEDVTKSGDTMTLNDS